ncbi:hypothetical protein [Nitrosomonas sp. Nm84]|uniref:hypothetical protein n=1 Tax=Nitrosomonas sp. Nm84 TaxID=200124 RepID=UPI001404887D|nr:hypothetical protein [Nitrosomonas sp. Nm84]
MRRLIASKPLENVFEATDVKQKQARKRHLHVINAHLAPVVNTVATMQKFFNGLLIM